MSIQIQPLSHYKPLDAVREGSFEIKINEGPKDQPVVLVGSGTNKDHIVEPENRINKLKEIYGEKVLKQMGIIPCESCESRTYVDGSSDPGVSFKTPTNVSPEASEAAVASHEGEHVANEKAKAQGEGREILSQSVRIFKDICPECGRMYTSGGVTHTTSQDKPTYKETKPSYEGQLLDLKI